MGSYEEMKFTGSAADSLTPFSGKNILHFSDGTLDLDELDVPATATKEAAADPQKLSWAPWMWYYTMVAGSKALEVCDYLGEFFATIFGITTPKYQYEITEYYRIQKEEQQNRDLENHSNWSGGGELNEGAPVGQKKMAVENLQLQFTNSERC